MSSLEGMGAVRRTAAVAAALAGMLTAGCSGTTQGSTPAPNGSDAAAAAPAAPAAAATKLLVVIEENHSLAQMRAGMPYAFRLAKKYGYANQYHAITHPSLPNYLAIAGGNTFGVSDDAEPAAHRLTGHSVFGQALAHHRTATVYVQSMPSPCATVSSDPYAVKHNPWAYFVRERRQCRSHDVGMRRFGNDVAAGRLPTLGMVVPDLQHDAHNGSLQQADAWFHSLMRRVFAGPDWRSGHLVVVLTADEDDGNQGNRVLTVVIHPSQRHHVVTRRLGHYSLTRLYDEVAHLPLLRHARTAHSMAKAFGLPLG
ncbi:MAG TPA: alkaline phosphatase family protein [Nocardioidaceae bacterium]|nr:alkaline phosphatase family protein [Nocardioidaceae bacterium]